MKSLFLCFHSSWYLDAITVLFTEYRWFVRIQVRLGKCAWIIRTQKSTNIGTSIFDPWSELVHRQSRITQLSPQHLRCIQSWSLRTYETWARLFLSRRTSEITTGLCVVSLTFLPVMAWNNSPWNHYHLKSKERASRDPHVAYFAIAMSTTKCTANLCLIC